jgi:hypothetical protein
VLTTFKVEEIKPFTQTDLRENSVYVLDAFFEFYLWIGSEAKVLFKDVRLGMETSLDYVKYVIKKQPERLLAGEEYCKDVWVVQSGQETPGFKAAFSTFDDGSEDLSGSSVNVSLQRPWNTCTCISFDILNCIRLNESNACESPQAHRQQSKCRPFLSRLVGYSS